MPSPAARMLLASAALLVLGTMLVLGCDSPDARCGDVGCWDAAHGRCRCPKGRAGTRCTECVPPFVGGECLIVHPPAVAAGAVANGTTVNARVSGWSSMPSNLVSFVEAGFRTILPDVRSMAAQFATDGSVHLFPHIAAFQGCTYGFVGTSVMHVPPPVVIPGAARRQNRSPTTGAAPAPCDACSFHGYLDADGLCDCIGNWKGDTCDQCRYPYGGEDCTLPVFSLPPRWETLDVSIVGTDSWIPVDPTSPEMFIVYQEQSLMSAVHKTISQIESAGRVVVSIHPVPVAIAHPQMSFFYVIFHAVPRRI